MRPHLPTIFFSIDAKELMVNKKTPMDRTDTTTGTSDKNGSHRSTLSPPLSHSTYLAHHAQHIVRVDKSHGESNRLGVSLRHMRDAVYTRALFLHALSRAIHASSSFTPSCESTLPRGFTQFASLMERILDNVDLWELHF